jgi:hypothetical protein
MKSKYTELSDLRDYLQEYLWIGDEEKACFLTVNEVEWIMGKINDELKLVTKEKNND